MSEETAFILGEIRESVVTIIPYKDFELSISCLTKKPVNNKWSSDLRVYLPNRFNSLPGDGAKDMNTSVFPNILGGYVIATGDNIQKAMNWIDAFTEKITDPNDIKGKSNVNHYLFVEQYGKEFSDTLGVENIAMLLPAHGDKIVQYRDSWIKEGLSFNKAAMVFLLSYIAPYSDTVRTTSKGFFPPKLWVIEKYKSDDKIQQALANIPD